MLQTLMISALVGIMLGSISAVINYLIVRHNVNKIMLGRRK